MNRLLLIELQAVLPKHWLALIVMLLCNNIAYAWNVTVQTDAPSTTATIKLENDVALSNVDVYLTWLDLDDRTETAYRSWLPRLGWQTGLMPGYTAKDLAPFSSQPVSALPTECPAQHRCFLAWVATPSGADPLEWRRWKASTLLPLNAAAATARLPGQRFFLASNNSTFGIYDASLVPTPTPPLVPAGVVSGVESKSNIQKPDVLHLEGTRLFYANGQAQRLQIIETADAKAPQLVSSTPLTGLPKEIYALGGYHLLLQNTEGTSYLLGQNAANDSQITVFRENTDGSQSEVSVFKLPGQFLESRRRGDLIYTVTTQYDTEQRVVVLALAIDANGQISERTRQEWNAADAHVALFADYLVIAGVNYRDWMSSELRVFDLRDPTQALQALPPLTLPGRVPSEFHIDVNGKQLRVVYSASDIAIGSVLSVYDLSAGLAKLGSVSGIAPKESLFATRFADNFAYVVTYQRKDPLWVIGLSDPTKPVILGELQVPGWSEKLFVQGDRVFGLGIDDQPAANETWARRVAASLFDVSAPALPTLLGRFTAQTGESTSSWSLALNDERGLLLDWQKQYALFPVEAWSNAQANYLQWVDFSSGVPRDGGQLNLKNPAERSVALGSELWGVLGNQSFLTVARSNGLPQVLGEVELARNLNWLYLDDGGLWAAATGNQGFYRLYRQQPAKPTEAEQSWDLDHNYNQISASDSHTFFLRWQPFALRALDRVRGEWLPTQTLTDATAYYGQAFSHGNRFYLSNSLWSGGKVATGLLALPDDTDNTGYVTWSLQGWQATAEGTQFLANYNIPGQPVGLSSTGALLVQENGTAAEPLRIDLLTLDASGDARLRDSLTLPCPTYSNTLLKGDTLYLSCTNGVPYGIWTAASAMSDPILDNSNTASNNLRAFRVNGETLTPVGQWSFDEWSRPLAASNDGLLLVASVGPIYYAGKPYVTLDTVVSSSIPTSIGIMPPWSSGCRLYDMSSVVPVLLDSFDNCPAAQNIAMDGKQVYFARGLAGIEVHQIHRK